MIKNLIKRQGFKMLCMLICCIFALNIVVVTRTMAAQDFIWYEDFEGIDGTDKLLKKYNYVQSSGTAVTLSDNAAGKEVRLAASQANTSNKDTSITTKTGALGEGGITFAEGKTYIFETDFLTSNANGRKEIFRYGAGSNECFMIIRNKSGSSYLEYPNTKSDITVSTSSFVKSTPIEHSRTYKFTFVVDGTTRKYDLYMDGEKIEPEPNNNIDNVCEFAPLPANITKLAMYSQNKAATDYSTFDNIMVYELSGFEVLSTNTENFGSQNREINIKFNNIVDSSNAGSIGVYNGENEIPSAKAVKGNTVTLTLGEDLTAGTSYSLRISGTKDVKGNTVEDTDIPFTTVAHVERLVYLDDNFEDTDILDPYAFTCSREGSNAAVAAVTGEENKAIRLEVPAPSSGSYTAKLSRNIPDSPLILESGKKYIFSVRVKSDVDGNQRKMFVYGTGTNDCLFNIKDIKDSGRLGLFKTNTSDTRLGTWSWLAADGWIDVMAVLDGGTKTYDVYVSGNKINTEPLEMTNAPAQIESIGFYYQTYGYSVNYFDDIKIYKPHEFNRVHSSTEDGEFVNTYDRQFKISYDSLVDPAALGDVAIIGEGNAHVACTASVDPLDNRNIIIDINGDLLSNTEYTIVLSGVRDIFAGNIATDDITFTTDNKLNISYPVLMDSEGTPSKTLVIGDMTAKLNVNKAKYSGEGTPVTMVIAYYKNGELSDIAVDGVAWDDITEVNTELSATVTVDDDSDTSCIKVFIMNSIESLSPLRKNSLVGY